MYTVKHCLSGNTLSAQHEKQGDTPVVQQRIHKKAEDRCPQAVPQHTQSSLPSGG